MNNDDMSDEQLDQLLKTLGPALSDVNAEPIAPSAKATQALNQVLARRASASRESLVELTAVQMKEMILCLFQRHPMDGPELSSRLQNANIRLRDAGEGELYGLLKEMKDSGLIDFEWKDGVTRRKKVYSLTDSGRSQLKNVRVEEAQMSHWLNLVIHTAA
jgi:DNA-binding PadR family transcriptional regulator